MKVRIRQWLRSLIGWDEIPTYDSRFAEFEEQIKSLEAKIPRRRDIAHAPLTVTDWETAQAAFMNDPKNFDQPKEMN